MTINALSQVIVMISPTRCVRAMVTRVRYAWDGSAVRFCALGSDGVRYSRRMDGEGRTWRRS